MNNPNPLVPQGSVLEQQSKGRSRVRIALFVVVALHVVFLGPLLIQGCKPESGSSTTKTNASYLSPLNASNLVEYPGAYAEAGNTQTAAVENLTAQVGGPTPVPGSLQNNTVITPVSERLDSAATSTHKIAAGDTFGALAQKYHVSLKDLMAANPNANPNRLKINETIIIPAAASVSPAESGTYAPTTPSSDATIAYKVKAGDNLTKIANNHRTTVRAIQTANGMRTTGIKVGQTIKIPAKAPTASASAESPGLPMAPAMSPAASLAPAVR